jgi:hypothetical protein
LPVNCVERLVEMFGSQADVARAFQLDRAVVHNWVKTGYVPARWASEVERVTEGASAPWMSSTKRARRTRCA